MKSPKYKQENSGFALLMSLIVVGVVLSVGITLLDLTIKQLNLSTNARESEVAFHAANAGAECARYWRRTQSVSMLAGDPITPECFGESTDEYSDSDSIPILDDDTDADANLYTYSFEWDSGLGLRCTKINTLVINSAVSGDGSEVTNMTDLGMFPGYPETDKTCSAGSYCTVISVRGYNRPCSSLNGFGVVERDILVEF